MLPPMNAPSIHDRGGELVDLVSGREQAEDAAEAEAADAAAVAAAAAAGSPRRRRNLARPTWRCLDAAAAEAAEGD